ncbi:Arrestin domain-containing protein 4 [Fukomys damarensis]|uniref:Arrestin domain-containing protein 4 n=1 Tax=Fukomys damarensis TaxID=885580 RepID=A0A091CT18_FUKDA|nr:Arrestin domain-containing protein 4 [Fukomys damarensis]
MDCSLAVYLQIPGAKKLMLKLPLVMGTIPCNGFGSRNSGIASLFSIDMRGLTLTLPEQPEAPPDHVHAVSEDEFSNTFLLALSPNSEGEARYQMFACIQEFWFQPPPLHSEVDPHGGDPACFLHSLNE